jgi:hypothetical protein
MAQNRESMSFLDNLENSLKSLESQGERTTNDRHLRDAERAAAIAAAPWAEKLKNGTYTQGLLKVATRIGFEKRAKVYIAWIGTTLKLEARERKLELRPMPQGVVALFIEAGKETREQALDLAGDPEELVRHWLG